MQPSDKSKAETAASQQASGEGVLPVCAAADLQAAILRIASQIGDADRRHCEALKEMQDRLGQFGRPVEEARASTPAQHKGGLGRLEQEISALSDRINAMGRERRSHTEAAAATRAAAQADDDGPWDAQSAEALTRVCEMAAAEAATGRWQTRVAKPKAPAATRSDAEAKPSSQVPEVDRAWLEARFANLAALLRQSLADGNPAASLATLSQRLEQLEGRLDPLLRDASARLNGDWLKPIEGQIKELASQLDAVSRQLARLDTIDDQLRQLSRALEEHRHLSMGQPAALRDDAIEDLIHKAAERAAARVAPAAPAMADGGKDIGAIETLMRGYVAERREGEEATAGALQTIGDALARILERVEAMHARAPGLGAGNAGDGMEAEAERLAEAYAAGARVLGYKVGEPGEAMLEAWDYVPSPAPGDTVPGDGEMAAADTTQTREELRASAVRGKLKAQAGTEPSESAVALPGVANADGAKPKPMLSKAKAASRRPRLLIGGAMLFLFAAGYLIGDFLMGNIPRVDARSSTPAMDGAASAPEPNAQSSIAAPAANQTNPPGPDADRKVEAVPAPVPAKRKPAERKAADVAPAEAQVAPSDAGAQAVQHPASLQIPAANPPPAVAQPVALPAAIPGMVLVESPLDPGAAASPAALSSAAAQGDAFAQYELAARFAEGLGVPRDQKQALVWYERAATRGLASAQFRLGVYYERGIGIAADLQRAKIWYRRAADQNYVRAMHNLAVLIVGKGEDQAGYTAAAPWFREAAMRGYIDSQFNLGMLYLNGRGVAKDLAEAYLWFGLAARAGDADSGRRLDEVKAQLELPALEAAEKRLADWRPLGA